MQHITVNQVNQKYLKVPTGVHKLNFMSFLWIKTSLSHFSCRSVVRCSSRSDRIVALFSQLVNYLYLVKDYVVKNLSNC